MSVGGYAAFTLYVGAAFREANRDQRSLLRTKLKPLLARMREVQGDPQEWALVAKSMLINIQRIMGPGWKPNSEWMISIRLLLGELDALQERTAAALDVVKQAKDGPPLGQAQED